MRLKSLDGLRGHPLFMSAHLRAGAVSRTEDASGAAGGCLQSVESAVLRDFEDASRTTEGGFRAPNISSVPEKPIFYTECFRKRVAYHRRLFCAPSVNSVP